MSAVVIIAIVVLFLVATFILLIFLPKPKCFYSTDKLPKISEQLLTDLKKDVAGVTSSVVLYNGVVNEDCNFMPTLYEQLLQIEDLSYAALEVIEPLTDTPKMTSTKTDALCAVLPIKISGAGRSGVWCDGDNKLFKEGQWFLFDHTRPYMYHNKHKNKKTTMLLVHVKRPADAAPPLKFVVT